MARFCFYCQRELREGERCNCHAAQLADAKREAQRSSKESVEDPDAVPTEPDAAPTGPEGAPAGSSPDPAVQSTSTENTNSRAAHNSTAGDHTTQQTRRVQDDTRKTTGTAQNESNAGTRERFTSRAREQFHRTRESTQDRFRRTSENFDASKVKSSLNRFADEGRAFIKQIPQMLRDVMTHPENILALARRASNQWVIIVFLLEIFVTTFVVSLAYQNSSLGRFLAFALNQAEQMAGASPSPFALRVIIIAISSYLVRLGAYLMALRLNFVPITFQQAVKHAVPGSIYFTLILFFAIFFNRSSGIQVLFILALAWALRFLIDEKILRDYVRLRHDRILPTLIGIYFFTFLIMALVISLAIPEIGRVRPPAGPTIVNHMIDRLLGI